MQIDASFHLLQNESLSFKYHVERLYPFFLQLKTTDPYARNFLLAGNSLNDSFLYSLYEPDGQITKAAEAVLETKYKNEAFRALSLWNGEEDSEKSLGFSYHFDNSGLIASTLSLEFHPEGTYRLGGNLGLQSLIDVIVKSLSPSQVSVSQQNYFLKHQVFKDRPGVGWMLYLPRVLTVQQVPEARALVPVMGEEEKGKKRQMGTIIVSVTDEPFSVENPEHVKIANAIEIRLVDQDLLPLYASL